MALGELLEWCRQNKSLKCREMHSQGAECLPKFVWATCSRNHHKINAVYVVSFLNLVFITYYMIWTYGAFYLTWEVPSQKFQLEHSIKLDLRLRKWVGEPHQLRPQNPRWLYNSSESCRNMLFIALLSICASLNQLYTTVLSNLYMWTWCYSVWMCKTLRNALLKNWYC